MYNTKSSPLPTAQVFRVARFASVAAILFSSLSRMFVTFLQLHYESGLWFLLWDYAYRAVIACGKLISDTRKV